MMRKRPKKEKRLTIGLQGKLRYLFNNLQKDHKRIMFVVFRGARKKFCLHFKFGQNQTIFVEVSKTKVEKNYGFRLAWLFR